NHERHLPKVRLQYGQGSKRRRPRTETSARRYGLCSKCAAILAFTDDLGLRCANAQAFDDLNFHSTIIAARMRIRVEYDLGSADNARHLKSSATFSRAD